MKISNWEALPEDFKFDYDLEQLATVWAQLHESDKSLFPQESDELDTDLTTNLIDAWLDFHNGDFESAAKKAVELGDHGAVVLAKSVTAYCDYLCEDEDQAIQLLSDAMDFCEKATESLPDSANTHFVYGLLMGRYSQRISITKALSQGLGGKIREHLDTALELEPTHAEAHTASGIYHSEIIDKMGAMLGGMTYGAKKPKAIKHFDNSIKHAPNTPITYIEYSNGLTLLEGSKAEDKISELLTQATECEALDALQNCDVSFANDQFEE